jgi:hypothetical protein
MFRSVKVLFQRDVTKDLLSGKMFFEGYKLVWPDGRPVGYGVNAFCAYGQRLFGLGRYLKGSTERFVELICYPIANRDQDMTKLPGHRVRRFYLLRQGSLGTVHFMDGTPSAAVFDLNRDEPQVLQWIGLSSLGDGEQQWLDVAARLCDVAPSSGPNDAVDNKHIVPDSMA